MNKSRVQFRIIGRGDLDLVDRIVEVFGNSLSPGYLTDEYIRSALEDESPYRLRIFGAWVDGLLVGVRSIKPFSTSETIALEEEIISFGGSIDLKGKSCGMLSSSGVLKDYRRQGIGSQFIKLGLAYLKEHYQCDLVFTKSWDSRLPDASKHILKKAGFEEVVTAPRYWADIARERNIICSSCQTIDCQCSAIFMQKPILLTPSE